MRKQIKTLVNQDFDMMAPFIIRDEGNVPPLLFFHFKNIDPKVSEALNNTVQDDLINVESGFFVPMSHQSILENKDVFMEFMATIMAAFKTVGLTEELLSVVIAVTGKAAKINTETSEKESEADIFIVSGMSSTGKTHTKAKEIKLRMGTDAVICDLVESSFLDDGIDKTAEAFIGEDFFELYERNLKQLPEDKKNLGVLKGEQEKYSDDPAGFAADLIDSAMHATILLDSIRQSSEQ